MNHWITFEIWGEKFYPKNVDFEFSDTITPGEIGKTGRFKGKEFEYGSASFTVPKYHLKRKPFEFLADTFVPMLEELKRHGAEDWHISVSRIYFAQCNEELSFEEILDIARLKCPISYSAFSVETGEEEEIGFEID